MASLKYFLKEPDAKGETLVHLIFQYGYYEIDPVSGKKKYKFLKMSSGEKINPAFWNPDKSRARESRKFVQFPEFNARLENLENIVHNVYRRFVNDNKFPAPAELKKEVLAQINNPKAKKLGGDNRIGFFDFIKQVIKDSKTGIRLTSKGKHFSKYTIKGYVTTLNHLEDFQQSRNRVINFESIDMNFYNEWVAWFYKKNKSKNTVGKYIKNLKVFMNEALDKGLTKNNSHLNKKFSVLKEDSDSIYLDDDELGKMIALDLSNKPSLENVRDMFILDCYMGFRIADFTNLSEVNLIEIDGRTCVKTRMQKVEGEVIIPLRKSAIQILKKYNFTIPDLYSEQTMNKLIKDVGKLAGIDEMVQVSITKVGKIKTETLEKYKLISNHTARRSFATNFYLATKDTLAVMKMTGHRTERSFLKYIRVAPEQNARLLSSHPYFSQ